MKFLTLLFSFLLVAQTSLASYVIPNGTVTQAKMAPRALNQVTGYLFTVTSASASKGAIYSTANGSHFTMTDTFSSATTMLTTDATGAPSGATLTKVSGTGSTTITFSASTAVNVAAVGSPGLSGSSGTFGYACGGSRTNVTNLSVAVTTVGRPVAMMLVPSTGISSPAIVLNGNAISNDMTVYISRFKTSSSDIYFSHLQNASLTSNNPQNSYFPGSVSYVDFPSAGVNLYTISVDCVTASANVDVYSSALLVYEI